MYYYYYYYLEGKLLLQNSIESKIPGFTGIRFIFHFVTFSHSFCMVFSLNRPKRVVCSFEPFLSLTHEGMYPLCRLCPRCTYL